MGRGWATPQRRRRFAWSADRNIGMWMFPQTTIKGGLLGAWARPAERATIAGPATPHPTVGGQPGPFVFQYGEMRVNKE